MGLRPNVREGRCVDVLWSSQHLSTTQCGLATFSQALVQALQSESDHVGVIRVVDADEMCSVVDHPWVRDKPGGAEAAAAALNAYDVAIIQHEYGIFPGPDGDEVLTVARALRVPTITVLHTVLVTPSPHQREILEELAQHSSVLVTMTQTARQRLIDHYDVDPDIDPGDSRTVPPRARPPARALVAGPPPDRS